MSAESWLASLPAIKRHHPLAAHTTYRIGGPADWYMEVSEGWPGLVQGCRRYGVPQTPLGNGSNLLVSDDGVDGLVLRAADSSIEVRGHTVHAAAGARMVKVAQAAAGAGLTGFEWALGIPGMVGGSVHNNAGCFGSDIATTVRQVHGVTAAGDQATWSNAECQFAYRTSALRHGVLAGGVVTAAEFQLTPGDPAAIRTRMLEI